MTAEEIIEAIRRGDLPAMTGTRLTQEQCDEIQIILASKRSFHQAHQAYNKRLADYFNKVVKTRVTPVSDELTSYDGANLEMEFCTKCGNNLNGIEIKKGVCDKCDS